MPSEPYDFDWGDGWEPDTEAKRVVTDYLVHQPDQDDWAWEDHCEGLAGGLLHALHIAGIKVGGDDAARKEGE